MQNEDARPFTTHTLCLASQAPGGLVLAPTAAPTPSSPQDFLILSPWGWGGGGRSLPVYKFLSDAEASSPRTTL